MKKEIVKKILIILFVLLEIIGILSNVVLGYNPDLIVPDTSTTASTSVKTVGQKILGIVQIVGTTAAIITLIILGIKYMMGSAEEKAEYKKTLMPYLIGAILVLAATNITKWIYDAFGSFFNEKTVVAGSGTGVSSGTGGTSGSAWGWITNLLK